MKGDSHSQAQIDMINTFIRRFNRTAEIPIKEYDGESKVVNEDFFEFMLAVDHATHHRRILDAYSRAKSIYNRKKAAGTEFNESVTSMYELLKELGVIQEKGDGSLSLNE